MKSWWKRVALCAAWLGLVQAVPAQQYIPHPVGAARMPEPLGYNAKPQPPMVPGPITPEMAPPVPWEATSLNSGHSSAFQCENYTDEAAFYGSAGAKGYKLHRVGRKQLAFFDPNETRDTGANPNPLFVTEALNAHDIQPQLNTGPTATIGYLWCNEAIEFSAFYLFDQTRSYPALFGTGNFHLPFVGTPLGFEGNNGMFRQADGIVGEYLTGMAGAEFNYRRWHPAYNHVDFLCGLRYLYLRDRLNMTVFDDLAFRDDLNRPDPRRNAKYSSQVRNNIAAFQVGGEYMFPCPIPYCGWIWFGGVGKAGIGPNIVSANHNLTRGDNFQGFNVNRTEVLFAQVYELSAFIELQMFERVRLRAGYNALATIGVADSVNGVNFDLRASSQRNTTFNNGTQIYHGPMLELHLLY